MIDILYYRKFRAICFSIVTSLVKQQTNTFIRLQVADSKLHRRLKGYLKISLKYQLKYLVQWCLSKTKELVVNR